MVTIAFESSPLKKNTILTLYEVRTEFFNYLFEWNPDFYNSVY